ncbi:hypothetical protein FHG89_05765 [Micromonospora orduensis]|uniref:Uncharacterized protein n=1 Tax=Micromonospora orduensis TaxID=1420891 RepID=A0A5C4QXG6_9ACTN|nr:hypothetical protein [Micromonospora orduensis]TNH30756.1 hypothetical protein FHG89_05765 [Micromonospora orduensis]
MDTRLLHLPAHGCTPKAYLANTAMVVFQLGSWWRPRTAIRRDQLVRGLPVPHAEWRDEARAIGDRAETVALTFQFGRVTGPPPFEISN